MLREPGTRDRATFIELLAPPEVHTYLGGPRPRDELEHEISGVPKRWPGSFVVDLGGSMIGQILLRRATGHRRPAAVGKADLGYLFLPRAWGSGYAAEEYAAALGWLVGALPSELVVLTTQTANVGSMRLAVKLGFTGWSGSRHGAPSSGSACGPRSRRPIELVLDRADPQLDSTAGTESGSVETRALAQLLFEP